MLSLSIALASLVIVAAVVVLACFRFCPECRRPRRSHHQQQASRRPSLRIDMPPPYPGPFIPGQITDLVSPRPEFTAPNNSWSGHTVDVSGADEACGGVDVVDKRPIDNDDEGHFVPDAVEMNAKLAEAIPPPPNFDQRQHLHRNSHHRRQRQVHHHHQQQYQGEDNNCFVPDDAVPDRSTAPRFHGVSSDSSRSSASAGWRRQTSTETGGTDSSSLNVSACSSLATSGSDSGGFRGSSSPRLWSPPSFYLSSTASSSLASQSRLVLDDNADITSQTNIDYY